MLGYTQIIWETNIIYNIGNQCWDVSNLGGTICDTPMVRRFESCFGPPLQGASRRFGGPFWRHEVTQNREKGGEKSGKSWLIHHDTSILRANPDPECLQDAHQILFEIRTESTAAKKWTEEGEIEVWIQLDL
jgi:hypothetical protein